MFGDCPFILRTLFILYPIRIKRWLSQSLSRFIVYVPRAAAVCGRFTSGVARLTDDLKFFEKKKTLPRPLTPPPLCSRGSISVKCLKMKKRKSNNKTSDLASAATPSWTAARPYYTLLVGSGESTAVDHRKRLLNRCRHVFIVFLERPSSSSWSTVCVRRRLPATRTHKHINIIYALNTQSSRATNRGRVESGLVGRSVCRSDGWPANTLCNTTPPYGMAFVRNNNKLHTHITRHRRGQ